MPWSHWNNSVITSQHTDTSRIRIKHYLTRHHLHSLPHSSLVKAVPVKLMESCMTASQMSVMRWWSLTLHSQCNGHLSHVRVTLVVCQDWCVWCVWCVRTDCSWVSPSPVVGDVSVSGWELSVQGQPPVSSHHALSWAREETQWTSQTRTPHPAGHLQLGIESRVSREEKISLLINIFEMIAMKLLSAFLLPVLAWPRQSKASLSILICPGWQEMCQHGNGLHQYKAHQSHCNPIKRVSNLNIFSF